MPTATARARGVSPKRATTTSLTTDDGITILCQADPFAMGAEGRLYESRDGKQVIKIYTHPTPWREAALRAIMQKRGAIMGRQKTYWSKLLCWPKQLITKPDLGVVMPRAPKNLRPFAHLLLPRYRQVIAAQEGAAALGTWDAHIGLLIKLARAVHQLHRNNVCHSDLSANNLLVDPAQGQAMLIDCDGLVIPGSRVLRPTVLGTMEYMAPELVKGMGAKRPPQPTLETDRHALAVLIYRGLLFRHPLRGSAVYAADPDDDDRFVFGEKALYIEHPTDTRNRPKKPFLTSTILGREMQALFRRAFIDGLHHPDQRPTAEEWEHALLRLHDQVLRCSNPRCEARAYIFGYGKTSAWDCPWCGATLAGPTQLPMLLHYRPSGEQGRMEFDFQVIGWPKRTLHAWHIEVGCFPGPGADAKVYATLQWEQNTNTWRLENTAIADLRALKNGQSLSIAPGDALALEDGMQVLCGAGENLRVIVVRMYKR